MIFIKEAKNGTDKIIGDTLRANPENLVPNLKEAKKKLTNGTHAFTFVILYYLLLFKITFHVVYFRLKNSTNCFYME